MSVIISVVCALLLLCFFALVGRPILSRRPRPTDHASAHAYLGLQHQRELVYAAIKELELDRAVGKIADADYTDQRRALENDAVTLLYKLEQGDPLDDRRSLEQRIEQDVALLVAERDTASAEHADSKLCAGCGAARAAEFRFCPQCGAGVPT